MSMFVYISAPLNQVTYTALQQRRRRLLQFTSDGSNEVPNPLICLEESDVLIFRIYLDTSDRSAPPDTYSDTCSDTLNNMTSRVTGRRVTTRCISVTTCSIRTRLSIMATSRNSSITSSTRTSRTTLSLTSSAKPEPTSLLTHRMQAGARTALISGLFNTYRHDVTKHVFVYF